MKGLFKLLTAFFAIIGIIVVFTFASFRWIIPGMSKSNAKRVYNREIKSILSVVKEEDTKTDAKIKGVQRILKTEEGVVFNTSSYGIAPSSSDYGFFYPYGENLFLPNGAGYMEGGLEKFTKDGKGYSVLVNYNEFYIEELDTGFWYYEFHW